MQPRKHLHLSFWRKYQVTLTKNNALTYNSTYVVGTAIDSIRKLRNIPQIMIFIQILRNQQNLIYQSSAGSATGSAIPQYPQTQQEMFLMIQIAIVIHFHIKFFRVERTRFERVYNICVLQKWWPNLHSTHLDFYKNSLLTEPSAPTARPPAGGSLII